MFVDELFIYKFIELIVEESTVRKLLNIDEGSVLATVTTRKRFKVPLTVSHKLVGKHRKSPKANHTSPNSISTLQDTKRTLGKGKRTSAKAKYTPPKAKGTSPESERKSDKAEETEPPLSDPPTNPAKSFSLLNDLPSALNGSLVALWVIGKPTLCIDYSNEVSEFVVLLYKGTEFDTENHMVEVQAHATGNIELVGRSRTAATFDTATEFVRFTFQVQLTISASLLFQEQIEDMTNLSQKRFPQDLGEVHISVTLGTKELVAATQDEMKKNATKILRTWDGVEYVYKRDESVAPITLDIPVCRAVVLYHQRVRTSWQQEFSVLYWDGGRIVWNNVWDMHLPPQAHVSVAEKLVGIMCKK